LFVCTSENFDYSMGGRAGFIGRQASGVDSMKAQYELNSPEHFGLPPRVLVTMWDDWDYFKPVTTPRCDKEKHLPDPDTGSQSRASPPRATDSQA
jgi:hypothetical protein